ncbi:MAG: C cytochrome precursor [Pirellulales bacterium]|nr:C cytochrome precursor [Pirellulales bacterium]
MPGCSRISDWDPMAVTMTTKKRTLSLVALAIVGGALFGVRSLIVRQPTLLSENRPRFTEMLNAHRPIVVREKNYIGAEKCRACHPDNYASWHDSYHRTMTQVATADAAATSFEDVVLEFANSAVGKVTLRQEGENLWAEFEDKDSLGRSKNTRRPIVMMTGSHHAQGYWLPSGKGRDLERFPFMYRMDQKRWITDRSNFLIEPGEHVMAHAAGVWNHLCDRCHTTRPQPRLEADGHYDTHVGDMGIACEACHGPGAQHAETVASTGEGMDIVNPASLSPRRSAEVCGQCHSEVAFKSEEDYLNWVKQGTYYQPGDSLEDHLKLKQKDIHAFWPDGMVRISGREFNGLIATPCFAHDDPLKQMTCLSCHEMHQPLDDPRSREEWANDQLKYTMDSNRPGLHTNQACTQCHSEYEDENKLTAHTHHSASSTGSICYNCHMPHSTWGLMKAMRSHTVSSPTVEESLPPNGRPNACNLCHLDKSLLWTAEALHRQYGQPMPELNADQQKIASGLLWGLQGDAAQRAIIVWNMGWSPAQEVAKTSWMVPLLAQLLIDPYDAVRNRAAITLKSISGYENLDYDFLSGEEDRLQARENVMQGWDAQADSRAAAEQNNLLLDASGRLNQKDFNRLLRWRDDRNVFLSE